MLKVAWIGDDYLATGRGYGYAVAAEGIKQALAPYVDWDDAAPLAFTVAPPTDLPEKIEGKRLVAYTMFESPDLPRGARDALARMDLLVVPSKFCRSIFLNVREDLPVLLAPLGVDPMPLVERTYGVPFRFLWVGAASLRKGQVIAAQAYVLGQLKDCGAHLYLKTTTQDPNDPGKIETNDSGTIHYDTRNLTRAELGELYASAHAFVYPTIGEGFGMTLAEAMTSGLPCIAPEWGGHLEFASERNCLLLPAQPIRVGVTHGEHAAETEDGKYRQAMTGPNDFAEAMLVTMLKYDQTLELGAEGARYIRREFTWAKCGARIAEILTDAQKRFQL